MQKKLGFITITLTFLLFSSEIFSQKRYGLIFGTNYTKNKANIPELLMCESDANYLTNQIKKVGNFDEVKVLLGSQITKKNIEKEIKSLGNKAGKDDTVFLFFAGHGTFQRDPNAKNGMRNVLVCFERPHLSDEELNEYLKSITSPKTLFVFDCCFSGGIAKKGKKTRGAGEVPIPAGNDGVVKQNSEDFFFQNKGIIASSDDNQTSMELGGDINHGIFTYHFGKALETADLNGDKVVTALEAFFQTRDNVVKMAKENDHEQTPQVSGDASGILLAGKKTPEPPPTPPIPEVIPTPKPEPVSDPPKPDPIRPPVTNVEPVSPPAKFADLLIKTTIIKDRTYGLSDLPPAELIQAKRTRKGDRRIKVYLNDKEYDYKLSTVKSEFFGSMRRVGITTPGEIYNIHLKKIPAGVQKIVIKADEYPEIQSTVGIQPNKQNEIEVIASMSGYGAIQGNVFYKTLDNPVIKQPIYMPTIKSVNGIQKTFTDKDGNFWFTNLKPGDYEIRASFAEEMKLENSMLNVNEGEVTRVQIILNQRMPSTKTKY
ncbi:MAG: caspase family protein [Leptospiraceae bacterium]|nr:caspase family protein [Leptospiraceae bacterium]MCK6382632.1 caspase family protein [Leptospiraceae bacterium]NUM42583.1 caspase family protein [Leptospiraceae bacterium]